MELKKLFGMILMFYIFQYIDMKMEVFTHLVNTVIIKMLVVQMHVDSMSKNKFIYNL